MIFSLKRGSSLPCISQEGELYVFCCETKDDSKFEPKVWIFWLENRSGENLREGIEELFFFLKLHFIGSTSK